MGGISLSWVYWVILILALIILFSLGSFFLARWLAKHEPYSDFMHLRNRRKITFFRLGLSDNRVPLYVKAIPVVLVLYLANPIDIIPDFIPVLGYLDDVAIVLLALALMLRLTPRAVVLELIQQAREADIPAGSEDDD
jgi:uncharacterized membrane protein YkvA (DUF1232 family)